MIAAGSYPAGTIEMSETLYVRSDMHGAGLGKTVFDFSSADPLGLTAGCIRIDTNGLRVGGFSVIGPGDKFKWPVTIVGAQGCVLYDVEASGDSHACIYAQGVRDVEITGCRAEDHSGVASAGYGIAVNGQNVRVKNSLCWGARHGVALVWGNSIGVSAPPDGVEIIDCTVKTDVHYAADLHPATRNCAYRNCKIFGGVSLAGSGHEIENCVITASPNGPCVLIHEIDDYDHKILGCTMTGDVSTEAAVDFDRPSDASPRGAGVLTISDCTIRVTGRPVYLDNQWSVFSEVLLARNVFVGTDSIFFRSAGSSERWSRVTLLDNRLHGTAFNYSSSFVVEAIETGTMVD